MSYIIRHWNARRTTPGVRIPGDLSNANVPLPADGIISAAGEWIQVYPLCLLSVTEAFIRWEGLALASYCEIKVQSVSGID